MKKRVLSFALILLLLLALAAPALALAPEDAPGARLLVSSPRVKSSPEAQEVWIYVYSDLQLTVDTVTIRFRSANEELTAGTAVSPLPGAICSDGAILFSGTEPVDLEYSAEAGGYLIAAIPVTVAAGAEGTYELRFDLIDAADMASPQMDFDFAGGVPDRAVVTVTSSDEETVPVSSVTLDRTELTLEEGDSERLIPSVMPENATEPGVYWVSSDTRIVTVRDGIVSAVSAGSAVVTAKAGEQLAFCVVNVTGNANGEPKEDGDDLVFGLRKSEIEGYVTISFEDYGIRVQREIDAGDIEAEFVQPLGVILAPVSVPFRSGDSIAHVTVRLLEELGWGYEYTGLITDGFYLAAIQDFSVGGVFYASFGEFDAGHDSGWMITWNDWFIDASTAAFQVRDGDYVRWQYTCQLGEDIGSHYFERDEADTSKEEYDEEENGAGEKTGRRELTSSEVREAAASGRALTVSTKQGSVTLGQEALQTLAKISRDVTVSVTENGDGSLTVRVAAESGELSVPVTAALRVPGDSLALAAVGPDGSEKVIRKSRVEQGVAYAQLTSGDTVRAVRETKTFADVSEKDWFLDAVAFVSSHELFRGVSEDEFAPKAPMTRAMLATVLYRLEDEPAVRGVQEFGDVAAGSWYADAVKWAAEAGIVNGTGEGFLPDANVTREQIAVMLFRYAQYLGTDVSGRADLDAFFDGDQVSDWARDAMEWAVQLGIFRGDDTGSLNPNHHAARAEVAALMQRIVAMIVQ